MDDVIRAGGAVVDIEVAEHWVSRYTDPSARTSASPFSYPAYDLFERDADPFKLSDADLLAPGLLNVPVKLRAYYVLQDMRPSLEKALAGIPRDADACRMDSQHVEDLVAAVYSPLDEPRFQDRGVRRTTLSKVLHRKRPALFALHDEKVNKCYFRDDVIPKDTSRSWARSMAVFNARVASDVREQPSQLERLAAAVAGKAQLSHLRLLDIVAWHAAGKSHRRA
ncbi:DUF6308 family protein [Demequina flava]|uniref:DUF6308 family protein n=1 Tax=Demequina flava TaxID=1095025 RepID=UPI0007842D29|nr:DUF6308 family protein [Demequina flava]